MNDGEPPQPQRVITREIGSYGLALVFASAVFLVLAFTVLSWYRLGTPGEGDTVRFTFGKLHDAAVGNDLLPRSTRAYFGWLAWTLLPVLVVVGVLANLPSRFAPALRLLGLLVGAFGASMTYYSFDRLNGGHGLDSARPGVWLALVGYAVGGVGAAWGPRTAGRVERAQP